MAFTLTNGSATKIVDTQMQANALIKMGWVVTSGSATADADPWERFTRCGVPTYFGFFREAPAGSYEHYLWKASSGAETEAQIFRAVLLQDKIGGVMASNNLTLSGIVFTDSIPFSSAGTTAGTVYIAPDGSAVVSTGSTLVNI